MNYIDSVNPNNYHTRSVTAVLQSNNSTVITKLAPRNENFIVNKMRVVVLDVNGKDALSEPHDNIRLQIKDENTGRYRYDEAIPVEAFNVGGVDNNFPGRLIAGGTEQSYIFSSSQLLDISGNPVSPISHYPLQVTIIIDGFLNN